MTYGVILFLMLLAVFGLGLFVGVVYERGEWSKLIHEGRLPKPGQKWTVVQ